MNAIWTLASKDLRLLLRDPKAAIILLVMPFIFILVLGISLGEGFGQKPDERLRVSVVDLDQGYRQARFRAAAAWFSATPALGPLHAALTAASLAQANRTPTFPGEAWSRRVLDDLSKTGGIRVEMIDSLEEAEDLTRSGRRAAVIVFGPHFSEKVARCSFLAEGINPFFREGVDMAALDARVLRDPTQLTAAAIIEQVAQGSLLRVVLPWMIGQAFETIGQPTFIERLSQEEKLQVRLPFGLDLKNVLRAFSNQQKEALANGLQNSLQGLFSKYDLTAKTWDQLTRSQPYTGAGVHVASYQDSEGSGLLRRGALRYQILVPSYMVMFAFFLVLTVGWLFVAERRQGTLKRLRAAPLARSQIVLGKLLPCLFVSLFQGFFLLLAGKLAFDMDWGAQPLWLVPVVFTTSLAAMGLALLVAALARTETQVAIYGTLLVLVLAGISGCLMGDRSLMPETMQQISKITPHAWALDAYRQLLTNPNPDLMLVTWACLVLAVFGLVSVLLAWWSLKLE